MKTPVSNFSGVVCYRAYFRLFHIRTLNNLRSNFLRIFVFSEHRNLAAIVDLLQFLKVDMSSDCYWQQLYVGQFANFPLNFLFLVSCACSMIR